MKKVDFINPQKEKMLNKASVLFWKNGYSGTTMREIAKAYGCKAANIYNYFPNKEAILFEFLYKQINLIISEIEHLEDNQRMSSAEQLRLLISKHLHHALGRKRSSRILFDAGLERLSSSNRRKIIELRDRYDQIVRKIIQRGIDVGEFSKTDVQLAAFSLAGMIVRAVVWFSPKGRLSVDQVAKYISDFVLFGLRGDDKVN